MKNHLKSAVMSRRTVGLVGAMAALALAATGCGGTSPAAEPGSTAGSTKVTLVSSITGSSFLAVTAGLDQKIFEKHGVEIELIKVKSSAEAAAAVASGQADIAAMVPEGVVAVVAAGSKMKMVGNLLHEVQHRLEVPASITSAKDLAGKKVGVVGPGNGGEILAKAYLAENGVDPSEVTFVATGPQPAQLAALTTGQIEGAMLVPPYDLKAESAGMHPLSILREDFPKIPAQVFASSDRSLAANGESVKKFMAAATESAQWVVDHPEDATKILAADAQISPEDAKASFDRAKDAYSLDGVVSDEGLTKWLELSEKYAALPKIPAIADVYDGQYLPGK
ncbi:ABC transporter substrate-binding protein [Arthrobacter sp. UNC362MFTsu5.1]|uniref:ABC transporter substrate-binding protein n=1 Tax=Arthrobacter sp. UNC362MFTsu5.1 TaxID=1449044 RepID=UPI00068C0187|nr:ABC transporter substrate-binding protein [Arthrobacter sp. UNC362MFTsu5.1]